MSPVSKRPMYACCSSFHIGADKIRFLERTWVFPSSVIARIAWVSTNSLTTRWDELNGKLPMASRTQDPQTSQASSTEASAGMLTSFWPRTS